MGNPGKQRSKISKPSHPWQKERIDEERELMREYGLRNKREIWKMQSLLKNFSEQSKKIIRTKSEQSEKEKIQLLKKLAKLGILTEGVEIEAVLGLSLKDILDRRLQSVVFRKGLARSMKQARQFINHEHVIVGGKKLTSPSFLVPKETEGSINFSNNSNLTDEMHPERVQKEKLPKKPAKKTEKKEDKEGKSLQSSSKAETKPEKKAKEQKKEEKPKKEVKEDGKKKPAK